MAILKTILCFAAAVIIPYLISGVNSAIIVTKIKSGEDIRKIGSGNAGLTNTLRTQGKLAALFVLLGDILKGVISILIVHFIFKGVLGIDTYDHAGGYEWINYLAGVFAVLGHIFPIYYGFKGGKGILVTFSTMLAINPVTALILLGIFGVFVAITRYVSLGSIIAASCYPFGVVICAYLNKNPNPWLSFIFAAVIGFLLVFMHRSNIERLKNHTEKKLGEKSK
ncbi:MAG: glycerol-3-phosphate 1-O-acyltransferase PlsY [Ruminiclostridium sp.]|nr:glycerol-3-phosphate 1-O-acyltransferase PlsY [Ruminiclostridium sp.]